MSTALLRLTGQPLFALEPAALAHQVRLIGALRRSLSGADPARAAAPGADSADPRPWVERERVQVFSGAAVVPVAGMLAPGLDPVEAWAADCCRYEFVQTAAAQLALRDDVHTVIFAISSPGGYACGCEETAAIVGDTLAGKLTVAWTADCCASAAYWLAGACSRIVAAPSATVGSIGCKAVFYDISRMCAEAGIDVKVYASGQYKATCTPGVANTPEQDAFMQAHIEEHGARFSAHVSARRPQVAAGDMQGQWFTGAQAVERGLADATALHLAEVLDAVRQLRAV